MPSRLPQLNLRLHARMLEDVRCAAGESGVTVSEWIRGAIRLRLRAEPHGLDVTLPPGWDATIPGR